MLALSPKPTILVPENFNAEVSAVWVTEDMIALIAPRHIAAPNA
jgi:hypothetical protein